MIQPVEGLVVSLPVLVEAQCAERLRVPPHHERSDRRIVNTKIGAS
jgi:hypothetical protein